MNVLACIFKKYMVAGGTSIPDLKVKRFMEMSLNTTS